MARILPGRYKAISNQDGSVVRGTNTRMALISNDDVPENKTRTNHILTTRLLRPFIAHQTVAMRAHLYVPAAFGAVVLLLLVHLTTVVESVDRNNFKSCDQSSFCRRCRKVQPGASPFGIVPGTLNTYSDSVTVDLQNADNGVFFVLKVAALLDSTFHVVIEEKSPLKPRYRVTDSLKEPVKPDT